MLLLLILPARLSAATRTVISLADSGAGTLRSNIFAAATGDAIQFAVNGTILLTSGELVINRNLTIQGPGAANLTVSGNHSSRVYQIVAGTVTLSGLSIADGFVRGTNGANGYYDQSIIPPQPGSVGRGGGIFNADNLTLMNCVVVGNRVEGGNGGAGYGGGSFSDPQTAVGGVGGAGEGGGVCSIGSLTVSNSTFHRNSCEGGDGGPGDTWSLGFAVGRGGSGGLASGGAICNRGTLVLLNTTFGSNSARGGDGAPGVTDSRLEKGGAGGNGGDGNGGAIHGFSAIAMVNSTVSANTSAGGFGGRGGRGNSSDGEPGINGSSTGGLALTAPATATSVNCIIAGNSGDVLDVLGAVTSQGDNLIGSDAGSSGWVSTDLFGDPQLRPLQDVGGPTPVMPLDVSSPAIDAGTDAVLGTPYFLTTDQRGAARPLSLHVDIGAYEFNPPPSFPGRLQFSSTAYSVAEETDAVLITVVRSLGSFGVITAEYATGDGTATAPADYAATSGTLIFADGEMSKTFPIRINNDSSLEGNEVFNLQLSSPSTVLVAPTTSQVTILDNDRPQRLVTTPNDGGGGSLRNAIASTNNGDLILFAPVLANGGIIRLTSSELFINKSLTILGPGAARLAISGNNLRRVLHIGPQGNVAIHGLTITEGLALGASGNGPQVNGSDAFGGGVYNEGMLALFDCMITTNRGQGGRGGDGQFGGSLVTPGNGGGVLGGAIYNLGGLALTRCTLLGNVAAGGRGGDAGLDNIAFGADGGVGGLAYGGAVWNGAAAPAYLENCTFCDNHAVGGGGGSPFGIGTAGQGGDGSGGALRGAFLLESCTVACNSAAGGGSSAANRVGRGRAGGAGSAPNRFSTARNSIIALNTSSGIAGSFAPDVADSDGFGRPWVSQGWNLIGITDGSSGWTTNDFLGNSSFPLNPLLGSCQDNGGPVWTICPLPGSPARDQSRSALATDARGGRRVVDFSTVANAPGGNASDIGALEVDGLFGRLAITKNGSVARVSFKTDPGNLYRLQQTSVVTNRTWTNVASVSGHGMVAEVMDTAATVPYRFYRASSVAAPAFPPSPNGPGSALSFDGVDDYVAVPHGDLLNAYPLTISAWVRTSRNAPLVDGIISKYVDASYNGYSLFLYNGHVGGVYFKDTNNRVFTSILGLDGGFIADDAWHHVALVVDAAGGRIIVDGVARGSLPWSALSGQPQPGPPTTTDNLQVGRYFSYGNAFLGQIDDVRVWNVSRTAAQILADMRRQLTGNESGLIAYYRFDDAMGLIAGDAAPSGRYATLSNGPLWTQANILPFAPTVRTLDATSITRTAATLNGSVNPHSGATMAYFEWGPTPSLGSATVVQSLGSGTAEVTWSTTLTSLTPGATYYYRAVGTNNSGTSYGKILSFH